MVIIFLLRSILAGVAISLGSGIYTLINTTFQNYTNNSIYWIECGKIISSILFSIGLFIVCRFKLLLYTGKVGDIFEYRPLILRFIRLGLMMCANVVSAYCSGLAIYYLNDHYKNNKFINYYIITSQSIAENKISSSCNYLKMICQGLFCGSCVYMSVKSYKSFSGNFQGIILLIWFVFIFVYGGFQHCIANSFYFGQVNKLNKDTILNVVVCVLSNCFGTLPVSFLSYYLVVLTANAELYSLDNSE